MVGLVTFAGVLVALIELIERQVLAGMDASSDHPEPDPDAAPVQVRRMRTSSAGELHVEERGSGRPIVLLHGHGATVGTFSRLAPRLAANGHRVVALDQRGFGRSSAVPGDFTFRGLLEDVVVVLEELDLRDAVIVGHSMGGAVALGVAVQFPEVTDERVRGLVLLNSTARGPADDRRHRALVTAMDWPYLERLSRHPRHGVVLTRGNFGSRPRLSDVETARLVGLESPIAPRRGFARRLLGTDLTDDLSNVELPVLAVSGSADRVISARETEQLASLLPNAQLRIFDGGGHMLPLEFAAALADEIVAFAEAIDGDQSSG
jgi:pimeloyl-ACP methyl ester carboxylesterase